VQLLISVYQCLLQIKTSISSHIYNIVTGSAIAVKTISSKQKLQNALKAAGSKGVLVSGIQDKNAQLLVLAINQVLASEAFSTSGVRQIRKGSDAKVTQLIKDMKAGSVHTLIMSESCIHFGRQFNIC
jgi:molybdopterin-containing oxidoreductase family iron-sulfur binding subunit